jgi:hypothetical protein
MNSKATPGKTKQYSGVTNAIKANKPPEEERIPSHKVVEIFGSFGYKPNERNNDVVYWSTRPVSEIPKLVELLHKRREEENKAMDEHKRSMEEQDKAKKALGRLSDDEIHALYDEYGLPTPDPEWARNHLPNDPRKVRGILETQRKTADDMLKKHTRNLVNSIPETPKAIPPAPASPAPVPRGGTGGPGSIQNPSMMGAAPMGPRSSFFVGDNSIIRITNPNNPNNSTIWLVDSKKKVLRPFMSEQAFDNTFEDPEEARNAIVTVSAEELGPGGALNGFELLQGNQGVQEDGSMEDTGISQSELQNRYGKQEDQEGENKALSILDGVFGQIAKGGQAPQPQGEVPPQEEPMNNNPMGTQ